jgi:hypothetical protein
MLPRPLSALRCLPSDRYQRHQLPSWDGGRSEQAIPEWLSDPRVLALLQALCSFSHLPRGFRNRDLRPQVAHLLGWDLARYSPGAMTYDLRRLRLHGLIQRVPHTFRYVVTPAGLQLAFVLSRIYLRLLQPDWSACVASTPDLPEPLTKALVQLDAALQLLTAPSHSASVAQPHAA